jgi:small nuclear ribonucleoprotein (snRNP)-like protein
MSAITYKASFSYAMVKRGASMYEQYHICNSCMNRRVLLQTVSGAVNEGVIVNVDEQNVYLDTSGIPSTSAVTVNKKAKTSALGFGGFSLLLTAYFDSICCKTHVL